MAPHGSSHRTEGLSDREREIVRRLAAGLTNGEIAEELVLSTRTVQSHLRRVMRRTEARNRAHLAAIAALEGMVSVADVGNPSG